MRIPLNGFVGPAYESAARGADYQRCVNLFPEQVESGTGKVNFILRGTPGLKSFGSVTAVGGGNRPGGLYVTSTNRFFCVAGNQLWEFESSGTGTSRGTLSTSSGPVSMTDNGTLTGVLKDQLIIVDGTNGYILKLSDNTFTTIADADFPGGNIVVYQDGYFIVNQPNGSRFYFSALNDGTSWDALDFGEPTESPDKLIGLISAGGNLWLLNEQSYEVYYNSGNADTPLEPIQGASANVGCAARGSIAQIGGSVFFLGGYKEGNAQIFMSQGYGVQRVSNHSIERQIAGLPTVSDAFAFTFQQEGHNFYQINFEQGDKSWRYDLNTGSWHEVAYWDTSAAEFGRHRALAHAFWNGKNYVSDRVLGASNAARVYELDMDTYTDNGDAIRRIRTSPHVHQDLKRVFYNSAQFDMAVGVGLETGQGSDPQIMLRCSNDGGHTWGNEKQGSIGAAGQYLTRVKFNRLGSARDRVFELSISDPVKVVILGAVMDVEVSDQ